MPNICLRSERPIVSYCREVCGTNGARRTRYRGSRRQGQGRTAVPGMVYRTLAVRVPLTERGPRVLAVDDAPRILDLRRVGFQQPGIELLAAYTAAPALALLSAGRHHGQQPLRE